MKRTLITLLGSVFVLFVGLSIAAGGLFAHHGRGASYDDSKIITVKGIVTEWAWRNPHVALYVDVKNDNGNVVNWGFESQNVGSLSKLGMHRNSFRPGQEITIKFNPSRAGAPVGVIRKVYDAAGKEVLSFGGPIND